MRQTIKNLKGEIEFREKLSKQHVSDEILLPDYYKKEEHDKILLERINTTIHRMRILKNKGVNFSPFLELGAERGQRSLVLMNDFDTNGFAIDISYHQLKTMEHFSKLFKREKLPLRICCDAYHLPFKNNSFPFVFSYEFLHHFPSPKPIIKEIFRVLSDGYYFFDEEPFKRLLKIELYKKKNKIYSKTELRKNKYIKFIEGFISENRSDEVEHGVIENDSIALREWIDALSIFNERDVDLSSWKTPPNKLLDKLSLRNLPNILWGGSISGLCHKILHLYKNVQSDIYGLLGCPNCTISLDNGDIDRPSLYKHAEFLKCTKCGFDFPIKDGIVFLLPRDEFQQLYPTFLR